MPENSLLKVSIRQIKAARALLAWSQQRLAEAAGVSSPTIKRLEAVDGPLGGRSEIGEKIRATLEHAGVEFIDANGGGPGVRLRGVPQVGKPMTASAVSVLTDAEAEQAFQEFAEILRGAAFIFQNE